MALEDNEEIVVPENEGTGAENEENNTTNEEPETPTTDPDPQGDDTPVNPDPAVILDFPEFTAEKMNELYQKAEMRTDEEHIRIIIQNILYRVRSQANLGRNSVGILYDSPTLTIKEEYREAVINNLLGLGYEVAREVIEDEEEYGITISW